MLELEARSYARELLHNKYSNYIMQHLVGTFDPEIVWHARTPRTANKGQGGSVPRAGGLRGSAGSRFSLEVRQSHRPLEEPIDLLLPLGTERRR